MSYYHNEVTDFLEDSRFRKWVLAPDADVDSFWEDFMARYPSKSDTIAIAKSILMQVRDVMDENIPSDERVVEMEERIREAMPVRKSWLPIGARWSISAAAVLLIGVLLGWFVVREKKEDGFISYEELKSMADEPLEEKVNNTGKTMQVWLLDSTMICLRPNSSISYRKDFKGNALREVYLSGEAFFDVTRDVKHPFIVYSKELVTKVLGTSFIIKAPENGPEVEVTVKTGRVSVFKRNEMKVGKDLSKPDLTGIIIIPNQKIYFSRDESLIRRALVDVPEIITSQAVAPPILKFHDVPVAEVFTNMEDIYGIDIVYDIALLEKCLLTASFTTENLYEKMELICKGIEASFEVRDGRLFVTGRGCD